MSLAHLVQFNDQRLSDEMISDLLDDAPVMQAVNAIPASNGTNHRYKKQTTASSAAFRAIDAGATKTKSADTQVDVTLKVLDASFFVDVAEANGYRGGRDAYLEIELMRSLKQAMFATEQQLIRGTNNDTGGFAGLEDNADLDALADAMVYGAGGTDTNAVSSCYLVRTGDADLSYVAGNDGNISFNTEDEPSVIKVTDTGSATYPAYYIPVTGWGGIQKGSAQSVSRICNLDAGSPLTDDLIAESLSLFPASRQPNQIWLNRTSLKQLQQSRTATNVTGAPAPFPSEAFGIPVVVTDAIVNTEAVVS
jgi:hypothetical protein